MSSKTYLCFDCRVSVRRDPYVNSRDVRCSNCARECTYVGHKVPIPPRKKAKDWEALEKQFAEKERADALRRAQKQREEYEAKLLLQK